MLPARGLIRFRRGSIFSRRISQSRFRYHRSNTGMSVEMQHSGSRHRTNTRNVPVNERRSRSITSARASMPGLRDGGPATTPTIPARRPPVCRSAVAAGLPRPPGSWWSSARRTGFPLPSVGDRRGLPRSPDGRRHRAASSSGRVSRGGRGVAGLRACARSRGPSDRGWSARRRGPAARDRSGRYEPSGQHRERRQRDVAADPPEQVGARLERLATRRNCRTRGRPGLAWSFTWRPGGPRRSPLRCGSSLTTKASSARLPSSTVSPCGKPFEHGARFAGGSAATSHADASRCCPAARHRTRIYHEPQDRRATPRSDGPRDRVHARRPATPRPPREARPDDDAARCRRPSSDQRDPPTPAASTAEDHRDDRSCRCGRRAPARACKNSGVSLGHFAHLPRRTTDGIDPDRLSPQHDVAVLPVQFDDARVRRSAEKSAEPESNQYGGIELAYPCSAAKVGPCDYLNGACRPPPADV